MHVFITGAAGFIGANCAQQLLDQGHQVTGIDNMNDYYDVSLKEARLARLAARDRFSFIEGSIKTEGLLIDLFAEQKFDAVIHLAAQAGVRYSIESPRTYLQSNINGTFESVSYTHLTLPTNREV